jgi:two-component system, response regulator YesN
LKNYLTSDVEVKSALDCSGFEKLVEQFQPQILLIEMELVTTSIQKFLQQQIIPIVALTAEPTFQQAMKAVQIQAIDLFVKPIPLEKLKSAILTLPIKKQIVSTPAFVPIEAQLYSDLYMNKQDVFPLISKTFFLIECAQFQHNLALYQWLSQLPIFEKLTALPLQNRVICIVEIADSSQLSKQLRLIIQEWAKLNEDEINIALYDGEETSLLKMYQACKKVLTQRFYKGYGHIFHSAQSLYMTRLDPLLSPEAQQLWISSLEKGDLKSVKEFLYKLSNSLTFYHHDDVRIHLTSILAQLRRYMMKYHLQQQAKIEAQYRELFHLILEHPILYAILQEFILFTQMLIETVKMAQQSMHADYAELAVSLIEKHFVDSTLSLQTVANELNISANYLSNMFSKKRGIPFKKYLQQYRIQQAEKLLMITDAPISSIAEMVGFLDNNYFTKVFREYYHLTPHRYRLQVRKTKNHK